MSPTRVYNVMDDAACMHRPWAQDEVDHSLRIHYPTLTQSGCELLVAYSRFYKHEPPDADAFARQGVKVARIPLLSLPTD